MKYLKLFEDYNEGEKPLSDADIDQTTIKICDNVDPLGLYIITQYNNANKLEITIHEDINKTKYSILNILITTYDPYHFNSFVTNTTNVNGYEETSFTGPMIIYNRLPDRKLDDDVLHKTGEDTADQIRINPQTPDEMYKEFMEKLIEGVENYSDTIQFTQGTVTKTKLPEIKQTMLEYLKNALINPGTIPESVVNRIIGCLQKRDDSLQLINIIRDKNKELYKYIANYNDKSVNTATKLGEIGF